MTTVWIVLGVAVFLIFAIICWWIGTKNAFVKLQNKVKEAFSAMDVYMQQRYDLIPNLVETVKGYMKHEKSTFEDVVKARNSAFSATNIEDKQKAEGQLSGALKNLFALAESYPELKANTNFEALQARLENMETAIANGRRYYNACVVNLNNKIDMFPSSIVASHYHIERAQMFELADMAARKNVKVEF